MIGFLAAAALAAATPAPPPASVPASAINADPAIFVVHDADTTVYIFGTFHALDAKTQWFNDQVKDAFEKSDELVLETLLPEGPPKPGTALAAAPVRCACRSPPPRPSSRRRAWRSTPAARRGCRSATAPTWCCAESPRTKASRSKGSKAFSPSSICSASMPATAPAPPPRPGAPGPLRAPMASLSKSMAEMQSAWKRGDQSVFVRMLGQVERSSPDMYRMMFVERNAHFAEWIASRMQRPGTIFVAVGAGHLAGKDSVLVRLAERGIESSRVN